MTNRSNTHGYASVNCLRDVGALEGLEPPAF